MLVRIAQLTGEDPMIVSVGDDSNLITLKNIVHERIGAPPKHQSLLFNDHVLNGDEKTLKELGLSSGAELSLYFVGLQGGDCCDCKDCGECKIWCCRCVCGCGNEKGEQCCGKQCCSNFCLCRCCTAKCACTIQ
mmetsp:Transcript_17548/g.26119  ORF Transcript_17548/g.26119 Transcript_17548/m.26119 type:complete len:134 (+) Transcript_17548:1013-1414(+)